ncbi:unnamed protein product [Sphagnum balticum]
MTLCCRCSCSTLNTMAVLISTLLAPKRARLRLWTRFADLWLRSPALAPVGFLCIADNKFFIFGYVESSTNAHKSCDLASTSVKLSSSWITRTM